MRFIRYPGGKQQRLLKYIVPYLPHREEIKGKYTEPFAGSAAVFFALDPYRAILSDINKELIDLYLGIKYHVSDVWRYSMVFPLLKKATTQFATINLKLKILLTRLQELSI
jgi:DNA adenine methylase